MPIDVLESLHEVRRDLTEVNTADLCAEIICGLDLLLESTFLAVQPRDGDFRLTRGDVGGVHIGSAVEIRLERSLWNSYHDDQQFNPPLLPGICNQLLSYQVPLFGQQQQAGWGEIDLLGVSPSNDPVIFELKQAAGDHLLKMIVQGIAYGVALRKAWNRGNRNLSAQWRLISPDPVPVLPMRALKRISVVGVAPSEYWNAECARLTYEDIRAIRQLVAALDQRGVHQSFAAFDVTDFEPVLPTIANFRPFILPND